MTELFSTIPQIRKDLIVYNISQMKGNNPPEIMNNIYKYIKTLTTEEERNFAQFYLDLVFEKLKEFNNEDNSNQR